MRIPRCPAPFLRTIRVVTITAVGGLLLAACQLPEAPSASATNGGGAVVPAGTVPADAASDAVGNAASDAVGIDKAPHAVRLGTWNLENLGSRENPRTDEDFRRIAERIRDLRVDVLAVQEINNNPPMHRLMHHLGDDYRFALGTSGGVDRGRKRISVGFLYDRRAVELLQCEEMTDFPDKVGDLYVFHRKPVNAVFRTICTDTDGKRTAGLDFRAITVHMKASLGEKNVAKRCAEATILREYIAKLRARDGEDQDIIVLGDFNHTYDAPAHRIFAADEFLRYLTGDGSPTIVHFTAPIDQIAVTAGIRDEVIPGSFCVHNRAVDYRRGKPESIDAQKQAWRAVYSDHFPVTVDLDGSIDRDPDATFAPPTHPLPPLGSKAPAK